MVGRGDVDSVDIWPGEQFAEVVVGGAVGVVVMPVDLLLRFVTKCGPDIASSDVLDIAPAEESPLVAAPHVTNADTAHDDAVAGGWAIFVAQGGRSNNVRNGD